MHFYNYVIKILSPKMTQNILQKKDMDFQLNSKHFVRKQIFWVMEENWKLEKMVRLNFKLWRIGSL